MNSLVEVSTTKARWYLFGFVLTFMFFVLNIFTSMIILAIHKVGAKISMQKHS